jgi:hypothetical protein
MNNYVAVFTDHEDLGNVFWGAFANFPDAHTAIHEFIEVHPYYSFEEFECHEFVFGQML